MLAYLDKVEERKIVKINNEIENEDKSKNLWKYHCVVCDRPIKIRFYLCSDCETRLGKRASDRPKWVNFLINEESKERYRDSKKAPYHEIAVSDCSLKVRIHFGEVYLTDEELANLDIMN